MIRITAFITILLAAGCSGSTNSAVQDGEPRSLFADLEGDERETVVIDPADVTSADLDISPAVFDTVIVRGAPTAGSEPRVVEALLKGSFPDGCTQLHNMVRSQTVDGETVELTMRRPRQAICTQAVRPYRFFFELESRYGPGGYELTVNDRTFEFVIE